ncbi:hypothetical protein [Photobacterium leiognathi]|uniref:hypothetical protein n=1 Tax=Photobacterium leiognathi TaxID=553611 RepID=UPI0029824C73|nr:hypothetical protein [Photobacterium leiognathi]
MTCTAKINFEGNSYYVTQTETSSGRTNISFGIYDEMMRSNKTVIDVDQNFLNSLGSGLDRITSFADFKVWVTNKKNEKKFFSFVIEKIAINHATVNCRLCSFRKGTLAYSTYDFFYKKHLNYLANCKPKPQTDIKKNLIKKKKLNIAA